MEEQMDSTGKTFPYKVYQILNDANTEGFESIISWMIPSSSSSSLSGESSSSSSSSSSSITDAVCNIICPFKIHKPKEFEQLIMPKYFPKRDGSNKYRTFKRSMNLWCYERLHVSKGPLKGAYYHPFFQKDQPSLMKNMTRMKIKNKNNKKLTATAAASANAAANCFVVGGVLGGVCPHQQQLSLPPLPAAAAASSPIASFLRANKNNNTMMMVPQEEAVVIAVSSSSADDDDDDDYDNDSISTITPYQAAVDNVDIDSQFDRQFDEQIDMLLLMNDDIFSPRPIADHKKANDDGDDDVAVARAVAVAAKANTTPITNTTGCDTVVHGIPLPSITTTMTDYNHNKNNKNDTVKVVMEDRSSYFFFDKIMKIAAADTITNTSAATAAATATAAAASTPNDHHHNNETLLLPLICYDEEAL